MYRPVVGHVTDHAALPEHHRTIAGPRAAAHPDLAHRERPGPDLHPPDRPTMVTS